MKRFHNVPVSTYRVQLNQNFNFQQAAEWVQYFHKLGISHLYSSPILSTKPFSNHGYDIVDHSKLNPELGTEKDLESLAETLHKHQLGLILDIVPNHMYILSAANRWWNDVLENGPASPFAVYFDIDWNPPRLELKNKVLLPLLDQQYGVSLENQTVKVIFKDGSFFLELPNITLPTDPKSWVLILESVSKQTRTNLSEDHTDLLELDSIITALTHLPGTTETEKEKIQERQREKEVVKRRLGSLITQNENIAEVLSNELTTLNGNKGDPSSFNDLELFSNTQPYRLCFWRVASDEINYRRFFDVFELAGIRTENSDVFESIHSLIFDFIQKKFIDGLRIDHIDGLWDPEKYLKDIQERCSSLSESPYYVIVEKILSGNEKLCFEWPIDGSVGYDFLDQVNRLFVFQENKNNFVSLYKSFTDESSNIFKSLYACKKLILLVSMSSELYILSRYLDRVSQQHRSSRDFTADSLKTALRDVIACFPVYRSYIRSEPEVKIGEEDKQYVLTAISRAKYLNPVIPPHIFDFIESVLLLNHPDGLDDTQKRERENFVMRFQQLTGPVMAKGLEDTFFYRYYPLASLNEVGSDPYNFGLSIDEFHKKNIERWQYWPHSLLATSTHDTKRSEDVRARINVLSEVPNEWEQAIHRWTQLNQEHKQQIDNDLIPDRNDEYFIYQTLVGSWPLYPMDPSAHLNYMNRISAYIDKASKEAKVHTSWVNPNKKYDHQMQQFLQKILNSDTSSNKFLSDFLAFIPRIISAGMLNSLSQILLKFTSPGIPDIYQGNEIWNFKLVDPDNRHPVDFSSRKYLLENLLEKEKNFPGFLSSFLKHPEDGRVKLYITMKSLQLRQKNPELFLEGSYIPLRVEGNKQNHIIAFARLNENKGVIVVTTRFFTSLLSNEGIYINSENWQENRVELPPELSQFQYRDVFTGNEIITERNDSITYFNLEKVLDIFPFALLESYS